MVLSGEPENIDDDGGKDKKFLKTLAGFDSPRTNWREADF